MGVHRQKRDDRCKETVHKARDRSRDYLIPSTLHLQLRYEDSVPSSSLFPAKASQWR